MSCGCIAVLNKFGYPTTKGEDEGCPCRPSMPQKERWGRPYPDNLDWSPYSERLVKRGEFYFSLDFIDQWDELLARMNAGRRSRSYRYPEPFIAWLACIHVFLQMPYRQMEGFTRKLAKYTPSLRATGYTILFHKPIAPAPWVRTLSHSGQPVTRSSSTGSIARILRSRLFLSSLLRVLSSPSIAPGSGSPTGVNGCRRRGRSGAVGSKSMR